MTVKGVEGRRVKDPKTMAVMPVGEERDVPVDSYWLRRVACGDMERVDKAKAATKRPAVAQKLDKE